MDMLSNLFSIMLAVIAITASILVPPTRGIMLAVPLSDTPAHRLLDNPNIRLIGSGKISGSLLIYVTHDDVWAAAFHHRILLLNGAAKLCSESRTS